jgi:glycerol-3-phosphate acyltransferase PlsY
MNLLFRIIGSAICSYLLGSISFAIIITYLFTKKDVRDSGSGNAGMTNVLRTVGVFPAILTLIGDLGKAVAAICVSRYLFSSLDIQNAAQIGMYVGGLFVLLGHIYPLFFKFKGGKGVLTCAGVFLVLDWQLCLVCIAIFIIIAFSTGYVSLGSICSMGAAPILTVVVGLTLRSHLLSTETVLWQGFFVLIIAAISIFMHKENIKRLIRGEENGFKKKQKQKNK